MKLAIVTALCSLISIAQCWCGLRAVRRFSEGSQDNSIEKLPPVTVLKPLCGDEPMLEQALESCFRQDYPEFQIVFGVQNPQDPALEIVARLRARYPERDVALVVNGEMHGRNRKISNLINMLAEAKYELLVISDSDLHLPPNYITSLASELARPDSGLVTALYTGLPHSARAWPAMLGATQISHHFLPGVLMSRQMGREDCLGSTAMFRRETLERIGGFAPLANVLAEDNLLGQRIKELGLSVGLAKVVPAAMVPEACLRSLWLHELRWTRTIRELAPLSLLASSLQYPAFWALLTLGFSGFSAWSVGLFLLAWATRLVCAGAIDQALTEQVGHPAIPTRAWLLPLRDVLSVVEIAASFLVNQVTWRGHKMAADGVVTMTISECQKLGRADGPQ